MSTVTQEEIQSFVMPSVKLGLAVSWFANGLRSGPYQVAFVIRVSHRNVHLVTATRGIFEAVRHIDDPKLQLNADQRESGAWDFTDDHKYRIQEMTKLTERVGRIERAVATLLKKMEKPKTQRKSSPGLSDYRRLRQQVVDAGIPVKGKPSKSWLLSELEKVSNSPEKTQE